QHHQFIPVALTRSGVGLEDQVPLDVRLVGNLLQAVKEKPLEFNELNREPSTELVAGSLVVLRVDQQCQERAFPESAPEAFLELAGIRLLGRDLALVDLPSRGLNPRDRLTMAAHRDRVSMRADIAPGSIPGGG